MSGGERLTMNSPSHHVLLVEDDQSHAELVGEAFRAYPNFRLTILHSLSSANSFLAQEKPDLLFCDLLLPDGRGSSLLPVDREAASFPAVLITSFGDERTAVEVMKGGAYDYLTKSDQLFLEMPRIAERILREWQEIVKRREAEQALRRSEEHLRMALEAADAGTWEWDFSAKRFTFSVGIERFLNLSSDGTNLTVSQYLELVVPEDRQAVQSVLDQALEESAPYRIEPYQIEHRTMGPEGKERWLLVRGRVSRDERGEPLRLAGTLADITSRKTWEAKLRSTEDHLAHVSRVSTMGEMISGIAHELNQPLYAIQNYGKASLNMLARDDASNFDQIREWLEEITETAAHAGQVLTRLRNFVRKVPSQREWVNVCEVVETATAMVQYDGRRRSVKIEDTVSTEIPKVSIDAVQIEQVLVNLLRNSFEAIEHHHSNGSALVTIGAETSGDKVEVTVADNGPGLPEENNERVFDAFATTKEEGMGLGLAIARTIVEAHHGKLWATPNAEGGASFHFTLPVGQER